MFRKRLETAGDTGVRPRISHPEHVQGLKAEYVALTDIAASNNWLQSPL